MLSLPDDWDYSTAGLASIIKDGQTAVRSSLKELEELGYLKRSAIKENGKIKDWQYDIFEKPQVEKPVEENPVVENPQVENRMEINIEKPITKKSITKEEIYNIVEYLNDKAGKNYKPTTKATQTHIKARLSEGFTVDDFKTVIDKKVKEWKGTKMDAYLRPETLFGTKFEGYLNAGSVNDAGNKEPTKDEPKYGIYL